MDRRVMLLIACGHAADDVNQSFLPALFPLLVAQRHLTFAAVATLVLAQGLSSSVIQPLIGYLADKRSAPWLIALGQGLAGLGVAAIGFLDGYALIFCAALVSGMGAAFFHPEAARYANLAAGAKKASGVRWFSLGGSIGFALGPTFASAVLLRYGLPGTGFAAIPVAIMGVLLLRSIPRLRTLLPNAAAVKATSALPDDWSAFARLTVFIVLRSSSYIGLLAFIPLYFVNVMHLAAPVANAALTTFLALGIAGTFVGGPLADRYGRRAVLATSSLTALVFTPLLVLAGGGGAAIAGFAICGVLGFALTGSQPAQIVLGQEYLPNRMGTAAGVTLGLAFTLGGLFAPVLGAIGDRYGLAATMLTLATLSLGSLACAFTLPDPIKRRALLAARAPT